MSAKLVFDFPFNVSAHDAITSVAAHFGATVSVNGAAPEVPAHIKQAVENTATTLNPADNPANGVEMNPAIAFGALLNGAAGNAPATSASVPPSADVATSMTAHAANPAISQTSPPASSAPVAASLGTGAPTAPAAPTTPASVEFDATGLAWDARIHSGAKSKTDKGAWRALKGVNKELVKSVELELRAKYPAGAAAPVALPGVGIMTEAPTVFADINAKKAAALAYAKVEALRVAGPAMIDEATLDGIMSGAIKSWTATPEQNEWVSVYHAKYGAAYVEFMNRPEAPAPVAPTPPTSPAAVTVNPELDATGLPWDARIHLPAKLKDEAGVWVQRFDVPGETKLLVMAELRAALAGNGAGQPSSDPNGAAGASPVAPTPPVAPIVITADEAKADFTKMMQWIVGNQLAGRITATAGPDAAKAVGFADAQGNGQLVLMREQPGAWPYVVQLLQAQGAL